MEAIAKYDFKATANDELSFTKGSILKVNLRFSFIFLCSSSNIWSFLLFILICLFCFATKKEKYETHAHKSGQVYNNYKTNLKK